MKKIILVLFFFSSLNALAFVRETVGGNLIEDMRVLREDVAISMEFSPELTIDEIEDELVYLGYDDESIKKVTHSILNGDSQEIDSEWVEFFGRKSFQISVRGRVRSTVGGN